jgi:glycosyltransferase involved in cell wall biosynthesis
MTSLRILFVHASDEAYGADRMLHLVATGFRDRGHVPLVLLPADAEPGWLSARLEADGIAVERAELAVARRRYFQLRALPGVLRALRRARREVRAAALRHRADVIHVNTSALLVGAILGHPGGARLVWHVHEIVVQPRLVAWLFRLLPVLRADRVIAISEAVRRHLTPGGRFRRRVVTVHNGLPLRPPAPAIDRHREPLVACVGRLNRWKGQADFVAAAGLLASRFPTARFLIAGDPPPGEPERLVELETQRRAAGLEDRVELAGFVEDGAAIFERAAVAVVPSLWPEPFGLVVLEAMQAGCAVVATDHGGAAEMIEHERSGLLVPPGDPERLAAAIARVLDDPAFGDALGAAARARAEREFGVAAMLDGIERVYAGLRR